MFKVLWFNLAAARITSERLAEGQKLSRERFAAHSREP